MNHYVHPPPTTPDSAAYGRDFLAWIERQAELLRAQQFQQLDVANLLEELDGMKRSVHRELQSRLKILLVHLLKCRYQPHRTSRSWLASLDEQRFQISGQLEDSPSLATLLAAYADKVYPAAVRRAAIETGLPASAFPAQNPFLPKELLDTNFVP